MKRKDASLFLKSLKEEGIEEIYTAPPRRRPGATPRSEENRGKPAEEGWTLFKEKVEGCTLCGELAAGRKNVVFGAGNRNARLMFIGEAPGYEEDQQGLPFVGAAGQLLTKIIESIGLTRQEVFIANVLKCRPPGNRQPKPDEILNCEPYLLKQIELIKPTIICALGTFAAQTLLKTGEAISRVRGRFHDFHGIKVMCTYHPAYLLRNPYDKRKVWEDMKMIKKELEALSP